ncbi:MAG: hypothetical protein R3253_13790 [Longimicrobiales bacterium]|nr:hypothetical protein [Longimicrobiales bacterium]
MKRSAPPLGALAVGIVLALMPGCRPDDQRTDSVDPVAARQERESWDPVMVAQLDSGNAAVRADDFEAAQRHFVRVTEMAPDVAAGWFGLYLAEQGLGNQEAAAEALRRTREIASGATLIHPEEEGGGSR